MNFTPEFDLGMPGRTHPMTTPVRLREQGVGTDQKNAFERGFDHFEHVFRVLLKQENFDLHDFVKK